MTPEKQHKATVLAAELILDYLIAMRLNSDVLGPALCLAVTGIAQLDGLSLESLHGCLDACWKATMPLAIQVEREHDD